MSLEHAIDLSSIPAGAGRSPDLEAKRRRAWARLSDGERVHVVRVYGRPVAERAMPFAEAGGAYERVLYLLVATRAALTPAEVAYLQIARWYRNTDVATVRARLARMVEAGEARVREDGRFYATPRGLLALGEIEERWLARREGGLGPGGRDRARRRPGGGRHVPPRVPRLRAG